MLKRMMACLLTVALLLTATPMVLAAKSPYDVDGVNGVTANDALMLLQYNIGLIEAFPSDVDVAGITKMDAVRAWRYVNGGGIKSYSEEITDETSWITPDYLLVEGKAGETVSLPVYIESEENPLLLVDVPEIVYDESLLKFQGCVVDADSDSRPLCVCDGHFEILYHGDDTWFETVELQFTLLQDFTAETVATVELMDASVVVESETEWLETTVETEPGAISVITREDLEMIILFAQMLADDTIYTAESVAVLEAALEDAQAVLDDPDATPKEMLEAIEALNAAAEGLVELGETVEGALAQLQELVDEAYQLLAMEHSWSEYTHNNLDAAIDMVEMFVNDDTTDMELIQGMYDVLDEAIMMLEFVGSYGDVDGDGSVAAADALVTLQAATGKIEMIWAQWMIADVDADEYGEITAGDALMILQYATQKIDSFPIDDMYIE